MLVLILRLTVNCLANKIAIQAKIPDQKILNLGGGKGLLPIHCQKSAKISEKYEGVSSETLSLKNTILLADAMYSHGK